MHTALFRRNNVKQNRLEKNNILKKRTANVLMFGAEGVMWTYHGCNQTSTRSEFTPQLRHSRSGHRHGLPLTRAAVLLGEERSK